MEEASLGPLNQKGNTMYRLIYCSKPTETVTPAYIEKILVTAQEKNKKNGLTGILFYNPKYFIQALEGSREAVNETIFRISKDPRHEALEVILAQEVDSRIFYKWSMGISSQRGDNKTVFERYIESGEFNPYQLSQTGVEKFLKDLSRSATEIPDLKNPKKPAA